MEVNSIESMRRLILDWNTVGVQKIAGSDKEKLQEIVDGFEYLIQCVSALGLTKAESVLVAGMIFGATLQTIDTPFL